MEIRNRRATRSSTNCSRDQLLLCPPSSSVRIPFRCFSHFLTSPLPCRLPPFYCSRSFYFSFYSPAFCLSSSPYGRCTVTCSVTGPSCSCTAISYILPRHSIACPCWYLPLVPSTFILALEFACPLVGLFACAPNDESASGDTAKSSGPIRY